MISGARRYLTPQLLAALGGGLFGGGFPQVQPFSSLPGMGLPTNWAMGRKPAPLLPQAPAAVPPLAAAAPVPQEPFMDYVSRVRENR